MIRCVTCEEADGRIPRLDRPLDIEHRSGRSGLAVQLHIYRLLALDGHCERDHLAVGDLSIQER